VKGPGDLTAPDWVGFDALGRIVVKEWHGNHRVQIFDAEDGHSLDVFSLQHGSAPSGQAFIEGTADNQRIVFTSGLRCKDAEHKECAVQEQDFSGKILRPFGVIDEIEPGWSTLPFVMGTDGLGHVYLAHRNGGNVVLYDSDRERTGYLLYISAIPQALTFAIWRGSLRIFLQQERSLETPSQP